MKNQCIPTTINRWIPLILVSIMALMVLPRSSLAAAPASLDDQLLHAAKCGDVASIKTLLVKGANANARDNDGVTPLTYAVWNGSSDIANLLIDKGADVNVRGPGGRTVLMDAAGDGKVELVRLLLDKGADVNASTKDGDTALMIGAWRGGFDVVKLLIDRGALVNQVRKNGGTALISAAYNGPEVVQLLIEKGADVKAALKSGKTVLDIAVGENRTNNVKILIENGVNIDSRSEDGRTPLMKAAQYGYSQMAKLLTESGADVNARDRIGRTPLMMAAQRGHLSIVSLLIEKGADPDVVSTHGRTALGLAEAYNQFAVINFLRTHISPQPNVESHLPEYPPTPGGVVETFIRAALKEVPITLEEMSSCYDITRIQSTFLARREEIEANSKILQMEPGENWGPYYDKWNICTGFEIKEIENKENRATVKVVYKRFGWIDFNPFHLRITNDTQEVCYGLAKLGKLWRIVSCYEPHISISSAIKRLECEITTISGKAREYPSEGQITSMKTGIGILKQYLSTDKQE